MIRCQRNTSLNYSEIPLHIHQDGYNLKEKKKKTESKLYQGCGEIGTLMHRCLKCKTVQSVSRSVMSNSLQSHGPPFPSPGVFLTKGLNLGLLQCRLILYHLSYQGSPLPVFLPGEFHGQRSLRGYSQWGGKESETTEQLNFTLLTSQIRMLGQTSYLVNA